MDGAVGRDEDVEFWGTAVEPKWAGVGGCGALVDVRGDA